MTGKRDDGKRKFSDRYRDGLHKVPARQIVTVRVAIPGRDFATLSNSTSKVALKGKGGSQRLSAGIIDLGFSGQREW
jgi:hypothetical protein